MASLPELMREDDKVSRIVENPSLGHLAALAEIEALGYLTSDTAIRRARKSIDWARAEEEEPLHTPPGEGAQETVAGTGKMEEDAQGGYIHNATFDHEVTDFADIFRLFNRDPSKYVIVDNTVRSSTWQQSKRLENGERDVVQMYAYSCRFQRLGVEAVTEDDFEERRQRVLQWKPDLSLRRTLGTGLGEPCTYVHAAADWQLGKSEGGGYKVTEQRVLDALQASLERIVQLRKIGRNIEGAAFVNMGDPTEGCSGNYASQTFTVELTQRRQITLAMDLFEMNILNLASQVDQMHVIGTLCNHGEWTRQEGKAITSDSDNVSGFLLDSVQRVLKHRDDMRHVKWNIPQDNMITMAELSGVWNAFTHGHKTPSSTLKAEEDWLSKQTVNLLLDEGHKPRLWTTAHKHHANVVDLGPYWRIQCSALDGGSKWLKDINGKWSTHGTTTYLIGNHDIRGFSDWAVI